MSADGFDECADDSKRPNIRCPRCNSNLITVNYRMHNTMSCHCRNCRVNFDYPIPTIRPPKPKPSGVRPDPGHCPRCRSRRTGWKGEERRCFECGCLWSPDDQPKTESCGNCGSIRLEHEGSFTRCFQCGNAWRTETRSADKKENAQVDHPFVDDPKIGRTVKTESDYTKLASDVADDIQVQQKPDSVWIDLGNGLRIPLTDEQIKRIHDHRPEPGATSSDPMVNLSEIRRRIFRLNKQLRILEQIAEDLQYGFLPVGLSASNPAPNRPIVENGPRMPQDTISGRDGPSVKPSSGPA